MNRRHFLYASGAGLGGLLLGTGCGGRRERAADSAAAAPDTTAGPRPAVGATGGAPRASRIGVQLYTVRDRMKADVPGTLAALAAVGYRELEFAGYYQYQKDPAALRALLDRHQLTAPSTHVSIDALRSDLAGVLATAEALGHRYVVCPAIEPGKSVDDFRRTAGELGRIGAACRERGIRFAYHNHDFEFKPVGGTSFYDVLLEQSDPELVALEMDLFWTVKAGKDPLAYFEKHRGRFPLWHVKDMRDVRGAQQMVAVGEGDIDFGRIFAQAGTAGLEHFFVEHDNPPDPLASVRTGFGHLARLLA
jgi:sugar phosphate isomerase/epimerase